MSEASREINEAILEASPALYGLLSRLGLEAVYPRDIPFQAAEARQAEINATIGQITDGRGGILALPTIEAQLGGLGRSRLDKALLYSPVEGDAELRRVWARRHRPLSVDVPSSLPLPTIGLTGGLSLVADLFCDDDRAVLIPEPFWGNYRQIFGLRRGARIVRVPLMRDRRFDAGAIMEAAAAAGAGEPLIILLNFPSNPGGYSPTAGERDELIDALLSVAEERSVLAVCDDAYAGLVWETEVPSDSIFWSLVRRHPNLVPVKVDGVTKELVLFGGRLGFLTFPFAPSTPAAAALESKVKCLLRATVGSPVAVTQQLVLAALESPSTAAEVDDVHATLRRRYLSLRAALEAADGDVVRPLPFNSGCFALLELPRGVEAEAVRRRLLSDYGTGVIAIGDRHLRLAYCSVAEPALAPLVQRVEQCLLAELNAIHHSPS